MSRRKVQNESATKFKTNYKKMWKPIPKQLYKIWF